MSRPGVRAAAWAALLLLCAAVPALADRTAAEFYAQRGEKALREKDWAGAQEQLRKAMEEDPSYAPALGALGEALLGAGDRAGGLGALRKAVSLAEGTKPLPPAWVAPLGRFRKRLAEVDTAGVALDRIADKYVADLLAFGDRWVAKDPDTAAAALRDALTLRPADPRVKTLAAKIEKVESASWIPLFNGRDKSGWDWLDASPWFVAQGSLVGTIENRAMVAKTRESLRGDFDLRVEAKIVRRFDDLASFTLLGAWKAEYHHSSFGILGPNLIWHEEAGPRTFETKLSVPPSKVDPPFDPEQWTVYELRFRGAKIHAAVNGTVVATIDRGPERDAGSVGLMIQHVLVHFRRVEMRPR